MSGGSSRKSLVIRSQGKIHKTKAWGTVSTQGKRSFQGRGGKGGRGIFVFLRTGEGTSGRTGSKQKSSFLLQESMALLKDKEGDVSPGC